MTTRNLASLGAGDIDSRSEYWLFVRWIIKERNFAKTLSWVIRKCRNRFFINRSGLGKYPKEIHALAMEIKESPDLSKYDDTTENHIINYTGPQSIRLAGTQVNVISGNVDWRRVFSDREDEESLHRWNFLLYFLSIEKPETDWLSWAVEQMDRWIMMFQYEMPATKKQTRKIPRWESYTISERLSNSSIFFHISKIEPSKKIASALIRQASYLTKHLEYYGQYTSNHIVNNGRALYLFGVKYDIESFRNLGQVMLERELPNLVSPAGFVREGSSHYQFLITRWLLEVRHFCSLSRDVKFGQLLEKYCENLESKCEFFMPETSHPESCSYPLFGDISPDFPPSWVANILTSRLVCKPLAPGRPVSLFPESSWNWIWE